MWVILSLTSAVLVAFRNVVTRKLTFTQRRESILFSTFVFSAVISLFLLFFIDYEQISLEFFIWAAVAGAVDVLTLALFIRAISLDDIGRTFPLVAFTPVFIMGTSYLILGETPSLLGTVGIISIVLGAYLLRIENLRQGIFAPFKALFQEPASRIMLLAAFLFSLLAPSFKKTVVLSSPFAALVGTQVSSSITLIIYLMFRRTLKINLKDISKRFPAFLLIGLISFGAGISLLIAFQEALAAYAVSIKRTSILFTIVFGFLFFKEKNVLRSLGAGLFMLLGIFLISIAG